MPDQITTINQRLNINPAHSKPTAGEQLVLLNRFLTEVECQALKMATLAVRDREEAFDIVQDVMLAFVRRYSNKPQDQWPPLFFRCVNNRIKDWFRKQKVRSRWFIWNRKDSDQHQLLIESAIDSQATPGVNLDDKDFGQALSTALEALPQRQREAFLLRSWQGFSVAETALAMGCGEGSVKTHLSRALSALRQQLVEFSL